MEPQQEVKLSCPYKPWIRGTEDVEIILPSGVRSTLRRAEREGKIEFIVDPITHRITGYRVLT